MILLDILIAALLAFGLIRGFFRGFVLELSGLIGIIISIYVARYYSLPVLKFVESLFHLKKEISPIVGFIVIFLLALILFHFLALLVDKFVKLIALGWLNKLLGGLFAFVKYLLIISVLINVFDLVDNRFDFIEKETKNKSKLYMPVKKIVPIVLPFINMQGLLSHFPK